MARHDLRRNFRSAIDPRGTRTHSGLAPPPPLAENAVFQSFVLLLAATYAMLLYRNLGDVRTLLGRISRDAATGKRFSEDPAEAATRVS